jgi:hypothetical protein
VLSPIKAAQISRKMITIMFNGWLGIAATVPAAKSRESPGRKGVTTRPVSQKMMRNKMK